MQCLGINQRDLRLIVDWDFGNALAFRCKFVYSQKYQSGGAWYAVVQIISSERFSFKIKIRQYEYVSITCKSQLRYSH